MKNPEIQQFLDNLAKQHFGWSGDPKKCKTCNKLVGEFKNKLSEKEYGISGMCQECQDKIWG